MSLACPDRMESRLSLLSLIPRPVPTIQVEIYELVTNAADNSLAMISRKRSRTIERIVSDENDAGGHSLNRLLALACFFLVGLRLFQANLREASSAKESGAGIRWEDESGTSRGATITWLDGTAVISRDTTARYPYNAIMCRLYATIIATARGAERRGKPAKSH